MNDYDRKRYAAEAAAKKAEYDALYASGAFDDKYHRCSSCGNQNAEDVAGSYSGCCNKRVESV